MTKPAHLDGQSAQNYVRTFFERISHRSEVVIYSTQAYEDRTSGQIIGTPCVDVSFALKHNDGSEEIGMFTVWAEGDSLYGEW